MKKLIKYDFSHYNVLEFFALVLRVIKNLLNNPDFAAVQAEIAPLQLSANDMKDANTATLNGGPQQTEDLAAKRAIVNTLMVQMASDCETECAGNRVKALGTGFDISKASSIKKVFPLKVTGVEALANGGVGMVDVSWSQEVNRIIYRIEKAVVTNGAPGTFTSAGYTSTMKYTVTGLTAGIVYQFRVISINNLGEGDPSDTATAMSL